MNITSDTPSLTFDRALTFRGGQFAVGAAADLALFRLDELRFSGALDPLAALVVCGAHRADRVMVAGRWVVEDGQIPGLDLGGLMRAHGAAARALAA